MNRVSARLATAATAAALLLTGCASAPPATTTPGKPAAATPTPGDATALLARNGLAGKTPEQVIEALDQDPRPRPLPLRASVRSNELILTEGTTEARLPLTTDRFYLSVAPYATRTHECYFHNLGTCQGELAGKPVHVTITDAAGQQLVDADATTYANGFVAFWIPRNTSGTITVTADGKTGTTPFDSKADGATCVTTLRLT